MTPLLPRPRTLEVLAELIRYDTTSRNSNLELIDYAETSALRAGGRCERITDETGRKATLLIRFGPENRAGVLLSGHSDTVPVEGQSWTHPPHDLTRVGDRLYGRGTSDMKGFLACCLALAEDFGAETLQIPIDICITYDEEIGCLAVRPLLAHFAAKSIQHRACIVGEPTSMQVAIGHKAKRNMRVRVKGTPGHSGRAPSFVNAVEYGARLIVKIQEMGRRLAREHRDDLYEVPVTTAHVGQAQGGIALNVVPEDFEFVFEFRALPVHNLDDLLGEVTDYAQNILLPEMRSVDPRADIYIAVEANSPGIDLCEEAPLAITMQRLARQNGFVKLLFGTEGGIFQDIGGIPTVVCGPGSIDVAHQPDEYIELSQLALCEDFLLRLLSECRTGALTI